MATTNNVQGDEPRPTAFERQIQTLTAAVEHLTQQNHDLEEQLRLMAGSCNCSITLYEDDLDDSAEETIIKWSHDDHDGDGDGDGDGPSGEVTHNEVDAPQPKRMRLPDLIERFIPHLGNWIGNSSTQEQGDSDCEEEKSQWNW